MLIADDHMLFRHGLRLWLATQPDFDVVAEAADGHEVVESLRRHAADVAVLDLSMPGSDGVELIERIKRSWPLMPVLVLTMHDDEHHAERALRARASGYVTKDCAPEEVGAAIRRLAGGGEYVSPRIAERLALRLTACNQGLPHTRLSGRESTVFEMLVKGRTGTQIAAELSLSKKTVSTHKTRLLRKMNLRNGFELMRYAIAHGLQPAPDSSSEPRSPARRETARP